jgi:hypothetical protein
VGLTPRIQSGVRIPYAVKRQLALERRERGEGEVTRVHATRGKTLTVVFAPAAVGAVSTLARYSLFHHSTHNLYFSDYALVIELIYLLFIGVLWRFLRSEDDSFRRLLAYGRTKVRRHLWLGFLTFLGGYGIIMIYVLA